MVHSRSGSCQSWLRFQSNQLQISTFMMGTLWQNTHGWFQTLKVNWNDLITREGKWKCSHPTNSTPIMRVSFDTWFHPFSSLSSSSSSLSSYSSSLSSCSIILTQKISVYYHHLIWFETKDSHHYSLRTHILCHHFTMKQLLTNGET